MELLKYQELKVYRNGDVIPSFSTGNESNLLKGTKDVKRYLSGFTAKSKRIFISRCIYLYENKIGYVRTFTLTYRNNPNPQTLKKHINTFLTYCRKNKIFNSYCYTIEQGEVGKKLHIHFIVDMNYFSILKLNYEWCKIRNDFSLNGIQALQRVYDIVQVGCYAAKYISKSERSYIPGYRIWATSNNLAGKEFLITNPIKLLECSRGELPNQRKLEIKNENNNVIFEIYTGFYRLAEISNIFKELEENNIEKTLQENICKKNN